MNKLNIFFFGLLISYIHNFYSQYNSNFLLILLFLLFSELIIFKIFNRLKRNQQNQKKFKFNSLTNIDPSIDLYRPYITEDKNTKHIVSAYDAMAERNEYIFRIKYMDNFILQYLNDERDIVTAWMFINLITVTLPLIFINLYFSIYLPDICAPFTLLFNMLTFTDRFILGLHYSSHKPIWKGYAYFMNYVPSIFIAPFFGLPSGCYWTHHILMHHHHNNEVGRDLSSTEPYQRDNFFHFLHYWLRFLFGIWFELPIFALKHGPDFRKSWNGFINCKVLLFTRILFSSIMHLYLTYLAIYNIPWAGTWLVAMPLILSSFLLMFGNWSQHMFVDPERPWNNFSLSYTCMNSPTQQRSFNDGYHINHHIAPLCHWADLPADFERLAKRFDEEQALCFSGIDNFVIGFNVFLGRLDKLAEHMVNPSTGGPWKTDEQGNVDKIACIAELRRRLKPVSNSIQRPIPNHRGMKSEQ